MQELHYVNGNRMTGSVESGFDSILFGLGCFWGAERKFWEMDGVHTTQVGYAGGHSECPSYEQVCTGLTGHAEVVRVVHDPQQVSLEELLAVFWESHDPTQLDRQGNDIGSQYRSCIICRSDEDMVTAERSRQQYQNALTAAGRGQIVTEILPDQAFYPAEDYHQQYLAKNPDGYCGIGGTGVCYL